jgi:hypothetical protein
MPNLVAAGDRSQAADFAGVSHGDRRDLVRAFACLPPVRTAASEFVCNDRAASAAKTINLLTQTLEHALPMGSPPDGTRLLFVLAFTADSSAVCGIG